MPLLYYHIFLYLSMSIISWAKLYISLSKRRIAPEEQMWEMAYWSILALLFSFGLIDLLYSGWILSSLEQLGIKVGFIKI